MTPIFLLYQIIPSLLPTPHDSSDLPQETTHTPLKVAKKAKRKRVIDQILKSKVTLIKFWIFAFGLPALLQQNHYQGSEKACSDTPSCNESLKEDKKDNKDSKVH